MTEIRTPADVRQLRQRAELTQEQLARRLGVATSAVVRLEAGHVPLSDRWRSHLELLFASVLRQEHIVDAARVMQRELRKRPRDTLESTLLMNTTLWLEKQ